MSLSKDVVDVTFGNDRVLLYNVHPWKELGFGVPNFGDNISTLNLAVHNLADYMGKSQLFIMSHIDAQRTQPPSANTIIRLMKILNRISAILNGRKKLDNEVRTEEQHASPDMRSWLVHPVPYFESGIVRNHWLKEYNMLTMMALTNIYQHSDNNLALTVTERFAGDIGQFFNDMKILLGVELLGLDKDDVSKPNYVFNTSASGPILTYNPSAYTLSFEMLDTPGPIEARFTEDDLREFFIGIPASVIKKYVAQYPALSEDPGDGYAGRQFAAVHAARGTIDNEAVQAPGGTIHYPTL